MEPAELISEAYLRIARAHKELQIQNAKHFIALAILNMHRILIDHARSPSARATGHQVPLEPETQAPSGPPAESLYMRALLRRLALVNQRQFAVVKMRFYWGLELEEIANLLSVSTRTVRRDWMDARGWLRRQLTRQRPPRKASSAYSPRPFTPGIAA
jgi:RNA polymerase sigma factor (TIGR02999 family)